MTATHSSAIAVGSGLALTLGGQVEALLGWRWAFFLLGLPGLLVWRGSRKLERGV